MPNPFKLCGVWSGFIYLTKMPIEGKADGNQRLSSVFEHRFRPQWRFYTADVAVYIALETRMGVVHHSVAGLRFFGDDLIPDEITALLGATPTESCHKGQEVVGKATGKIRVAKTGSWRLKAERREPEDLEAQVFELLGQLTQDLRVWESLSCFRPDLFCGIFMGSSNDGLPLSAKALLALGQRGIALDLDIYDFDDEDASLGS